VADYSYDGAGRIVGRTDGSGLVWTQTYEAATGLPDTRTVTSGSTTLLSADLSYDSAGNVTSRTQSVNGVDQSFDYSYDPAGRLVTATPQGDPTTTYGYDGAGNRISVKVGSDPAVTTEYDAASLPLSSSDGTTYAHDAVGNLTGIDRPGPAPDETFGYDAWSRMRTAGSGATQITYVLDALSRPVSRTEDTGTTSFAYRGTSEDRTTITAGSSTTIYAYGVGGPLAQSTDGVVRALLSDLHGDIVGLATSSGTVAGTRSFDPWGGTSSSAGESTNLGFQGDPTDPDTGLVDMLTRYYTPELGRFTTRDVLLGDPVAPATLNQYTYVSADPVSNTDPTGMCAMRDCPPFVGDYRGGLAVASASSSWQTPQGAAAAVSSLAARPAPIPPSLARAIRQSIKLTMIPSAARAMYVDGGTPYGIGVQSARRQYVNLLGVELAQQFTGTDISQILERTRQGADCGFAGLSCVNIDFSVSLVVLELGLSTTGGVHVGFGLGWPGGSLTVSGGQPGRIESRGTACAVMCASYGTGISRTAERVQHGWSFGIGWPPHASWFNRGYLWGQ
jgi:RHS repeat-associated protein